MGRRLPGANRWCSEPSLGDPPTALASSIGRLNRELRMESYPKFHNEVGAPIVRIGSREFECIGDRPPEDHPHIFLSMGDASEIVCPYCSTLFRFDPRLGAHEADPADCAYDDMD
jgi:uncharacterized Zn-finger protein